MPDKLKSSFYRAINDMIKIIETKFIDFRSEGWMAENAKLFIIEGGQRSIIGNNVLPQLRIEVRHKQNVSSANEVEHRSDSSAIQNSPIQRNFI